jgi:hypothetical protein
MALLVSSGITIFRDISLETLYIRLDINFIQSGNEIVITPHPYTSKQAFKESRFNNELIMRGFDPISIEYNYEIDGDMILHAHNSFVEYVNNNLTDLIPINSTIIIDLD